MPLIQKGYITAQEKLSISYPQHTSNQVKGLMNSIKKIFFEQVFSLPFVSFDRILWYISIHD